MAASKPSQKIIMIPIVGTDKDASTLAYYWNLIASENDHILIVHVFRAMSKEKWHKHQGRIQTVTSPFSEECKKRNIGLEIILHVGNPGDGIIEMVKKHKPHLLIIGTRELSPIRRTVENSVSAHVIHHAHIPVLVVPNSFVSTPEDSTQEGHTESDEE